MYAQLLTNVATGIRIAPEQAFCGGSIHGLPLIISPLHRQRARHERAAPK
jgi:hypothetical protein